jgi:hypothetical protein
VCFMGGSLAGEGGVHEVNAAGGAFLFGKVVARFGLGCKRGVLTGEEITRNPRHERVVAGVREAREGLAFGVAAGGVVAGFVTAAEGVVGGGVEQVLVLIHVFGAVVMEVILADAVGDVVGVSLLTGGGGGFWRGGVGVVAGAVVV